jgi:hypothetical protein
MCHLAQAQWAQSRMAQAEANRRECLDLLARQPGANVAPAIASLVQSALDRGDSVQARAWMAQLPSDRPNRSPEMQLVRARLALLEGEPGVDAQLQAVLRELPEDRRSRHLRWQALSLQAAYQCLNGRGADGIALRERTLAEAQRAEPEHLRQQRRLSVLSSACAPAG